MPLKKKAPSSASSSRHDLHCCSYTDKWICQIVKKSQPSYKNTDILWEVCVGCQEFGTIADGSHINET